MKNNLKEIKRLSYNKKRKEQRALKLKDPIYKESLKEKQRIANKKRPPYTKEQKRRKLELHNKRMLDPKYKEKYINKAKEIHKNRYKRDILYQLKNLLRIRLNHALNGKYKTGSAIKDLGCSIEELKSYLESKFYPNPNTNEPMTWDNRGVLGWHIDHIIPLSSAKTEEELIRLCHYTNLQPLWAKDNLAKGNKIV